MGSCIVSNSDIVYKNIHIDPYLLKYEIELLFRLLFIITQPKTIESVYMYFSKRNTISPYTVLFVISYSV